MKRPDAGAGVSAPLVERNLDLIVSMAGRGFVMDKGRIVRILGPDETGARDAGRRSLAL